MATTQELDESQQAQEQRFNETPYALSKMTYCGYYAIGYSYELLTNPQRFITQYLYNIASKEGAALAPTFAPALVRLGYAPAIFVLGPYDKKALIRLFRWGESSDDDPAARQPLDRVKHAVGTDTIAQFRGDKGIREHRKIKRPLNNVLDTYNETFSQFSTFAENWNYDYSYQENIRYLVSNIIGKCIFGIPHIPIEDMNILQNMSYALAYYEPKHEEFKKASIELQELGNRILEQYGQDIIDANKYLAAQLDNNEGLEKLFNIKAGSSILVEGNLSNTIMIALAFIMDNDEIKEKLRQELKDFDFGINPEDAEQAKLLYSKLNTCRFLQQVYMEALRYVSPGVMTARKTSKASEWNVHNKEGNIRHFSVPAGSYLFAPLRAMSHDKRLWKEPHQFDPSRFDSSEKLNEYSHNGSIPFLLGDRSCPAAAVFAKLVFKLAVGLVITQYDFTLKDKMNPIPSYSIHPIYEPPTAMATIELREDSKDNSAIELRGLK
ncbi:hypothetical protein EP47_11530 [Legionella norrlandica]|uniref:Cytochrome P450 n=1 Tax=Legionella norrlandica TaxID=1498499 RepID=A0A0A2SUJ2_9GAMM|nr:cytochrome P450 [Legionella norrlandica]KGP64397.1 hypothetical protein EP47_11530 [Legionella norrlandica]